MWNLPRPEIEPVSPAMPGGLSPPVALRKSHHWLLKGWCSPVDVALIHQVVVFSRSVMFNSLRPHGLQHIRPPCPSPSPGVLPSSCPLNWWCHPAIHQVLLVSWSAAYCESWALGQTCPSQESGLYGSRTNEKTLDWRPVCKRRSCWTTRLLPLLIIFFCSDSICCILLGQALCQSYL